LKELFSSGKICPENLLTGTCPDPRILSPNSIKGILKKSKNSYLLDRLITFVRLLKY
jgi:hypothetical protein